MKMLRIRPIEPLSLSLSPIGGMEIFTVVRSTPIPLPTTVAGSLGASMGVKPLSQDSIGSLIELSRKLTELCGGTEPVIQGPLICSEEHIVDLGKCYTYIYPEKLVSLTFIEASADISNRPTYLDLEKCKGNAECYIDFAPLTLVSVSLQRSGTEGDKTVRYGYMYRYPLTIHTTANGKAISPIYIYRFNCVKDLNTIIRFGGEGRIAKLTTRDVKTSCLDNIRSPLNGFEKGLYIALSPVPIIAIKKDSTLLDSNAAELPIPVSSIVGIPQSGKPPKIRIERLGLGFSEVADRRRPEILVLPPGTMIIIEESEAPTDFSELMRGLLNIGFASLYKLR